VKRVRFRNVHARKVVRGNTIARRKVLEAVVEQINSAILWLQGAPFSKRKVEVLTSGARLGMN
jgi:hypothetical protein